MATLAHAERLRTLGQTAHAHELYAGAASRADTCGYVHHAALAHERRAELLDALGRTADAAEARAQALERYRAWGAEAKVRALA